MADARVPLHAAAGSGAAPQPAALRPGGPTRERSSDWCGPAAVPSAPFLARRPGSWSSSGGYASFPAGLAAVLTRVPLVSVTTDAVPGRRQRPARPFRGGERGGLPGDGPAPGPRHRDAGAARARLAGPDHRGPGRRAGPRSACPPTARPWRRVGGSLGALRINRAVAELAGGSGPSATVVPLYQVTGRRDYDGFAAGPTASPGAPDGPGTGTGRLCYRVVPFEDRMPLLYGAADVVRHEGRRHDGGRAAGGGGPGHPRAPARGPAGPPDPQRRGAGWHGSRGARARPRVRRPAARARSSMRSCPTPSGCAPWARRRACTGTPTRRPASPSWSTPMPADRTGGGGATAQPKGAAPPGSRAAPAHPCRRHRRSRHERHRAGAAGHGPHRLGLGPEGLAGGGAPALARHHRGGGAPTGERGRCRRRDVLAGRAAREHRAEPRLVPGAFGSCPAPRCSPPSAPPDVAWPWRGRTARRRRPPCCR